MYPNPSVRDDFYQKVTSLEFQARLHSQEEKDRLAGLHPQRRASEELMNLTFEAYGLHKQIGHELTMHVDPYRLAADELIARLNVILKETDAVPKRSRRWRAMVKELRELHKDEGPMRYRLAIRSQIRMRQKLIDAYRKGNESFFDAIVMSSGDIARDIQHHINIAKNPEKPTEFPDYDLMIEDHRKDMVKILEIGRVRLQEITEYCAKLDRICEEYKTRTVVYNTIHPSF